MYIYTVFPKNMQILVIFFPLELCARHNCFLIEQALKISNPSDKYENRMEISMQT